MSATMRTVIGLLALVLALAAGAARAQNSAAFVSQSVPTSMQPGQTYAVSVTMQNTSAVTWTSTANYKLGSQNLTNNTTWGFHRVELPGATPVPPGGTVTFNFNVTAPAAAGIYNFQWQMAQEAVGFFGTASPNVAVDNGVGNAAFVSQSVPPAMTPGQVYPVSVTLQNTGLTTWTSGNLYRLGSQNPDNNTRWGFSRVELPNATPVPPGGTVTFEFNVTAPATNGTHNFQWRMARDGVAFFGVQTPNVGVKVGLDEATFVSQSVPEGMLPGQTYPVSVTMRNTGGAIWTSNANYKLGSQSPDNNTTWGFHRVELPGGGPVAANDTVTFNFNITVPSAQGTYGFHWKMAREGFYFFGQQSTNVLVNVGNHASFVSQSVPTTMDPGQSYPVSVTVKNTGSSTWTSTNNFKLGSANPYNNTNWGFSRVELPNGGPVAPGENVTFNFNATAPAGAGTYNFRWQMVQDGLSFFGQESVNVAVKNGLDKAEFVSQTIPPAMLPGQSYPVSVTMKNIGVTTWQPGTVSLGSQNPADNTTWGLNRVALSSPVAPGANATFNFNATAPATPGAYNFQWRLLEGASSWFGDPSTNVAVGVAPDDAAFVAQSVPAQMNPGQTYSVNVTLQNTGTSTWSAGALHRLGSANPPGNTTWGLSLAELPGEVPPGAAVTIPFTVTAPSSAGTYNFQWRMLHGTSAFGAVTQNAQVSVGGASSTLPGMNFIHVDHLNTPREIYDANQQLRWRWEQQEPFGVNAPDENPSSLGAYEFSLRFPGQYADRETNLYYNYFRDYDPILGVYKQSDPVGLAGGLNTYAYVEGNPINQTDPFGLQARPPIPSPNNARESAGYHWPRGDFYCIEWTCPSSPLACKPTDKKRPQDFLPAAFSSVKGSEPAGCTCTRLGYRQDQSVPNPGDTVQDTVDKAIGASQPTSDIMTRLGEAINAVRRGAGPLPWWHKIR
jgi:RHS repeat-associated protein